MVKTGEADGTRIENDEAMIALDDGSYRLSTPGTYTVTLTPTDNATVKGYCAVTAANQVYKTDVILNSEMVDERYTEATAPFVFTISVDASDTVVTFEPHWGIPVAPDIRSGATVVLD